MEKIVKLRLSYKNNNFETDYTDDGHDQINGVLEYIADTYVIPDLMIALRDRKNRKGRLLIGSLNLSTYGISDVSLQLETGIWVDVKEELLRNV
ncbi:hypothetical protein VSX61_12050 [Brenneria populi subsp. brevivirga]|uniref:hypothetical protein n=1 Tax=Brenneria populi TaxID=1505588 RepID=UPI002E1851DB|nr:hypothetical protein [Brenneria populi subsp. brevivirga]